MDSLVSMVKNYAKEMPSKLASDDNSFDEENVKNLFFSIMSGRGFILIDSDNKGFLVGIIVNNIWFPKILELHELAWWVKPEFRSTSVGGKLWIEFNKKADKLLTDGRIKVITTSLMVNSPEIDYLKRGYKLLEKTYIKEASCQQ